MYIILFCIEQTSTETRMRNQITSEKHAQMIEDLLLLLCCARFSSWAPSY